MVVQLSLTLLILAIATTILVGRWSSPPTRPGVDLSIMAGALLAIVVVWA